MSYKIEVEERPPGTVAMKDLPKGKLAIVDCPAFPECHGHYVLADHSHVVDLTKPTNNVWEEGRVAGLPCRVLPKGTKVVLTVTG